MQSTGGGEGAQIEGLAFIFLFYKMHECLTIRLILREVFPLNRSFNKWKFLWLNVEYSVPNKS